MEKKLYYLCTVALVLLLLPAVSFAANDRPLIYGMNPVPGEWAKHPNNPTWEAKQYNKMKTAGCASVRVSIGWDLVEPTPGARNWGDVDLDIDSYLNRGFEPVMLIVATPTWALLPGQSPPFYAPQPQFRPDFEKFVYDVARKFRGRVKYYEFWNEQNGWGWNRDNGYQNAQEYVPWLVHGYNAIKKGDPEALWSMGGLDDSGTGYGDDYLRKCYNYMTKGHFDAVCEHPYSHDTTAELWKLDDLRSVMLEYNDDLPIWITEMGWPSNGRVSTVAGWITDYLARLSGDDYSYCKIATYHTAVDFTSEDVGYGLMKYDDALTTKTTYNSFMNQPKPSRASVIGLPTVTQLAPGKVRITFSSTVPATAQIMYGLSGLYGNVTARETTPTTSHSFEIDGLQPSTTYHYRVRIGAGEYADNFTLNYEFATSAGFTMSLVGDVEVTNVTTNSATISWTTSVPSTGSVIYGLGYDYSHQVSDPILGTSHSFTITGLQPDSVYQVKIVSSRPNYCNLIKEIDPVVTTKTPGVLENGGFEEFGSSQPWIMYGKNDGRVTGQWWMGMTSRTGSAFFGSAASYDNKIGGCYQQIGAIPGRTYLVRAYTKSFQQGGNPGDDAARVGIDPTGGFDQNSTSIVWGDYRWDQSQYVPIECITQAAGDQITVYIDIKQPYKYAWNINAVDDVELYQFDNSGSLSETVSAPAGQNVAAMDVICTANFGDHIYVRSGDGAVCMRVNTTCSAQPGDIIRFTGKSAFTGLEKSADDAVATINGSGASTTPVGMLVKSIGGAPLSGQTETVSYTSGVNTLCRLVKVCGSVTESGIGYFRINDGSTSAGVKVLLPGTSSGPAVGSTVSAWGIAAAENVEGAWRPIIKLRSSSDYRTY